MRPAFGCRFLDLTHRPAYAVAMTVFAGRLRTDVFGRLAGRVRAG
jgi:hypothetical protein